MNPRCFRCGRLAFATLELEAVIGTTRLKIGADAGDTGICAPCMIALVDWLKRGQEVEDCSELNDSWAQPFTGRRPY
jgi:hypothetical protein